MTEDHLKEHAALVAPGIEAGQLWRHWRTGNLYRVLAVAHDESEPYEVLVVYARDGMDGPVWVRKASSWLEVVNRDVRMMRRFEPVLGGRDEG